MRQLVAAAMCQGALGLSTGLFYAPQSFATTEEVIALAREAAARGGNLRQPYARRILPIRSGSPRRWTRRSRIGREAHLPVHISHIKALGVDVQGQAPAIIAHDRGGAARRPGGHRRPISLVGLGHEPGRLAGAALGA